jgi:hypothetical protein
MNSCAIAHILIAKMTLFAQGSIFLFNFMSSSYCNPFLFLNIACGVLPCYWSSRGMCCIIPLPWQDAHMNAYQSLLQGCHDGWMLEPERYVVLPPSQNVRRLRLVKSQGFLSLTKFIYGNMKI